MTIDPRIVASALIAAAVLTTPAGAQDAAGVIQAADKASGASTVKSIAYSGTGRMGYPGQQYTSTGDLPRTDLKTYAAAIDYASRSAKEEFVRVQGDNIRRGGGLGFPVRGEQRGGSFLNGSYAWGLNPQGQPTPQPGNVALAQFMIDVSPHGVIKAALAAKDATLTERYYGRLDTTARVIGFSSGKYHITSEFGDDGLPSRVVTFVPDPVLGDKMVELRYSDWRDIGDGVKFPYHIHGHMGDHPLIASGHNWIDVRVTDAKANAEVAVPVPDNVRAAPASGPHVVVTKLADGVWLMGGGSHNSVAVEFRDFITVIEAPLDEGRSNAVIAEVRSTIPNKPIRYVVNTHNHFDHLGGIRAYVAEGATVVTDDRNRDFYRQIVLAPQPRTLSPDRLSQFPFAPTGPGMLAVQTFSDRYTISDGLKTIELLHIEDLNHSDNMLVAWLPQERILVNADLYSPPPEGGNLAAVNDNAVVFYKNIKRLKLDVARHVPIHGNPGPQADFERIVGPVAATSRAGGDGG